MKYACNNIQLCFSNCESIAQQDASIKADKNEESSNQCHQTISQFGQSMAKTLLNSLQSYHKDRKPEQRAHRAPQRNKFQES